MPVWYEKSKIKCGISSWSFTKGLENIQELEMAAVMRSTSSMELMKAIGRMGVHNVFRGTAEGMPASVITIGENLAMNVIQYVVSERGNFWFRAVLNDFRRVEPFSDVAMREDIHSRWVRSSSLSRFCPGWSYHLFKPAKIGSMLSASKGVRTEGVFLYISRENSLRVFVLSSFAGGSGGGGLQGLSSSCYMSSGELFISLSSSSSYSLSSCSMSSGPELVSFGIDSLSWFGAGCGEDLMCRRLSFLQS